jgi:hypothetical protein
MEGQVACDAGKVAMITMITKSRGQSPMITAFGVARLLATVGLLLLIVSGGLLARTFRSLQRKARIAQIDGNDEGEKATER